MAPRTQGGKEGLVYKVLAGVQVECEGLREFSAAKVRRGSEIVEVSASN